MPSAEVLVVLPVIEGVALVKKRVPVLEVKVPLFTKAPPTVTRRLEMVTVALGLIVRFVVEALALKVKEPELLKITLLKALAAPVIVPASVFEEPVK